MNNTPQRIFALLTILSLSSCDPALNGNMRVVNETDSQLTVVVQARSGTDTFFIEPHSNEIVNNMGGLGNKKTFTCCPCRLDTIVISSPAGVIKRNPLDSSNWAIPNKAKLKAWGGEDLRCEFYVRQSDL
ncbi:MAG: hypothetical protein KF744_15855 [Taibaiella sp.]|nr:hypothetical protein [Taibaiella sp.]